jgi:hypothetical protein
MNLATSSESSNGTARINFSLRNSGNEDAYNVMLEPILPEGFTSKDFFIGTLPKGHPVNGSFNVKIPSDALQGGYPVALVLHYQDANSYPFSVIFPESIVNSHMTYSKVYLLMQSVNITGPAPVEFNVKVLNQDEKKHNITFVLYAPEELSLDSKTKVIEVDGHSNATVENRIWSTGALYGSSYLLLASASYTEGGERYSSMAQGRVGVVKPAGIQIGKNIFMEGQWILILFVLIVIVILAFLTLRERRTRNEKKAVKEKAGGKEKIGKRKRGR